MATRRLYVSGTNGVMLIGTDDIYIGGLVGNPPTFAEGGAITSPLNYRDKLYFHSNLPYVQIKQKISPGDLTFPAQNRGISEWEDGGKGCDFGCFITTAAVKYMGEDDNSYVLNSLRNYRDSYMLVDPKLQEMVDEYYKTAPHIVEKLESHFEAESVFTEIYSKYLLPAVEAIEQNDNVKVLSIYTNMYNYAKDKAGV